MRFLTAKARLVISCLNLLLAGGCFFMPFPYFLIVISYMIVWLVMVIAIKPTDKEAKA